MDENIRRNNTRTGVDGAENRGEDFAMWLRRGRVGQLLPQIVLAHFSASNTVQ